MTAVGDASVLYVCILTAGLFIGALVGAVYIVSYYDTKLTNATASMKKEIDYLREDIGRKLETEKENAKMLKAQSADILTMHEKVRTVQAEQRATSDQHHQDVMNHKMEKAQLGFEINELKAKLTRMEGDLNNERHKNLELSQQLGEIKRNFDAKVDVLVYAPSRRGVTNSRGKSGQNVEDVTDSESGRVSRSELSPIS
jgi:gas vesicle protein